MQRNALARLSDVAQSTLPFLARVAHAATRAKDELRLRLLGEDFEERVRSLQRRYTTLGGDPFGFDPETARQAAMVVAVFHRLYFRTEVFGIENVPPGRALLSVDYSQIELRILAHVSEDPTLLSAFEQGQDIHAATAAAVYGIPLDQVTKEQRSFAAFVGEAIAVMFAVASEQAVGFEFAQVVA